VRGKRLLRKNSRLETSRATHDEAAHEFLHTFGRHQEVSREGVRPNLQVVLAVAHPVDGAFLLPVDGNVAILMNTGKAPSQLTMATIGNNQDPDIGLGKSKTR
jgi:hypothetical protein